MRINEKRLRQLIREAIKKEPLFDPVTKGELDDAMLRSRENAITDAIKKQDPDYTEEEARHFAQELIKLYDSNDEETMTQAEFLADTLGVDDPTLLDMGRYKGDREKFLDGQMAHAKSVASDQLRANLTDPNANFGNPQIGNPDLASDETRASKWWKENVLNKPAILEDLEIIPFEGDDNFSSGGIVVASSHKDVLENLVKNMLAHKRVGDSASYIKMDNTHRYRPAGGRTRKLGDLRGTIEYGTADPFQAYDIERGYHNPSGDINKMIRGDHGDYRYNVKPSGVDIGNKLFVIVSYNYDMTHSPSAYDSVAPYGSRDYDAPEGPFHGYQSQTAGAPPKRRYDDL